MDIDHALRHLTQQDTSLCLEHRLLPTEAAGYIDHLIIDRNRWWLSLSASHDSESTAVLTVMVPERSSSSTMLSTMSSENSGCPWIARTRLPMANISTGVFGDDARSTPPGGMAFTCDKQGTTQLSHLATQHS